MRTAFTASIFMTLATATLLSGCSNETSSPAATVAPAASSASPTAELIDTLNEPATQEVLNTIFAIENMISVTMSTGGTLHAKDNTLYIVDGTGAALDRPIPAGSVIVVGTDIVGEKELVLGGGMTVCVSVPDPTVEGQYLLNQVDGGQTMIFDGSAESSLTPCEV